MGDAQTQIPVVLCCADESEVLLVNVVESLREEGMAPEVLPGIDADPGLLGHAVDRNDGPGVYVLCESEALDRATIRRLDGLFSARKGPRHRLVVVRLNRQRPLTMLPTIREAVEVLRRAPPHRPDAPTGGRNLRDVVGSTRVDAVRRPRERAAESTPITPDELARQLTAAMEAAEAALDRRRARERQGPPGPSSRAKRPSSGKPVSGAKRPSSGVPVEPKRSAAPPPAPPAARRPAAAASNGAGRPLMGEGMASEDARPSPAAQSSGSHVSLFGPGASALPRPPTVEPSSSTFEGLVPPSASTSQGRAPLRVDPLPRPGSSSSGAAFAAGDSASRLGPVPTVTASSSRLSFDLDVEVEDEDDGGDQQQEPPSAAYPHAVHASPFVPVSEPTPRLLERPLGAPARGGAVTLPYPVPAPMPGSSAASSSHPSTARPGPRPGGGTRLAPTWLLASAGVLVLVVAGAVFATLDSAPDPAVETSPLAQGRAADESRDLANEEVPATPPSLSPGALAQGGDPAVPEPTVPPRVLPDPPTPVVPPVEEPLAAPSTQPSPSEEAPGQPSAVPNEPEAEPAQPPAAEAKPAKPARPSASRIINAAVAAGKMHAMGELLWLDPSSNAMDYVGAAGLCSVVAVDGIDKWKLPTRAELARLRGDPQLPGGLYWSRSKGKPSKPAASESEDGGTGDAPEDEAAPSEDVEAEESAGDDAMVVLDGRDFTTLGRDEDARALCVRWR